MVAAEWADLHPVPRNGQPAGWGEVDLHGEGLVPLAGEGTPQVAEFAPVELAGHLGTSADAGRQLIGDALELRHRLPRLFDLVLAGTVPAWRARQAAALTTRLTPEMATWVDKMLACDPQHLTALRVRRIIEETILHYDPDRAAADEQAALAARHVTLVHDSGPATTEVHMRLDTLDALHLDDTLADLATSLSRLGDTDSLEVRRAKAVGVLADPQRALDLLETGVLGEPTSRGGRVELFVHLASADLADPTRAGGEIERLGAATRGLLAAWLGRPDLAGITVRPVLDLHRPDTVDRHHPPAWMRETAVQVDATCVFPGLQPRLPRLRPGPHHRLPPDRGRRSTGPDPAGQPRAPVPHPPPPQDPRRVELPTPRRQPLPVDHPLRPTSSRSTPAAAPDADDPDRPTPVRTPTGGPSARPQSSAPPLTRRAGKTSCCASPRCTPRDSSRSGREGAATSFGQDDDFGARRAQGSASRPCWARSGVVAEAQRYVVTNTNVGPQIGALKSGRLRGGGSWRPCPASPRWPVGTAAPPRLQAAVGEHQGRPDRRRHCADALLDRRPHRIRRRPDGQDQQRHAAVLRSDLHDRRQ